MSITEKPWGSEELLEKNNRYVVKKICMRRGHRCSLQFHEKKLETVYVLQGKLKITSGPSSEKLTEAVYEIGQHLTLPPRHVHRMEALEDAVYLEASSPELDDVVRLKDDYKRVPS
jgi:mannose-6-phosphate isomerase-like protein (cupin superfamily)